METERDSIILDYSASGLLKLPLEMLKEICSHLCWHCQGNSAMVHDPFISDLTVLPGPGTWTRDEQAALLALTRASKFMRLIAEPFLYHYAYVARTHDLCRIVHSLVERPHLRSGLVEVGVLYPTAAVPFRFKPDQETQLPFRLITNEIDDSLRQGNWRPLWAALKSETRTSYKLGEDYAALVLLLLHFTPNLARAHFALPDPPCAGFLDVLMRWSVSWRLESLKRLTLVFEADEPGVAGGPPFMDSATYILRLTPYLEALHCHDESFAIWDCSSTALGKTPSGGGKPLQHLTEFTINDVNLINLLPAVGPGLRKFSIRTCRHEVTKFAHILHHLLPWTQTLKNLSFRPDGLHSESESPPAPPALLTQFRKLELLEIHSACVDLQWQGWVADDDDEPGATMLPPALRELRVCGYPGFWDLYQFLSYVRSDYLGQDGATLSRVGIDDQQHVGCWYDRQSGKMMAPKWHDKMRQRLQDELAKLADVGAHTAVYPVDALEYPHRREDGLAKLWSVLRGRTTIRMLSNDSVRTQLEFWLSD